MKTCTKCGHDGPLEDFPKNRRNKDGYHGWCKPCHSGKMRELRQRDPERARAKDRASYAKNREHHAEKARGYRRAKYARNPDHKREEWYRLTAGADLDWIEVLLKDPCAYCGSRTNIEIDHIIPGINGWDNLTACCRSCNPSKGQKPMLLHLAHQNGCYEWRRDRE